MRVGHEEMSINKKKSFSWKLKTENWKLKQNYNEKRAQMQKLQMS